MAGKNKPKQEQKAQQPTIRDIVTQISGLAHDYFHDYKKFDAKTPIDAEAEKDNIDIIEYLTGNPLSLKNREREFEDINAEFSLDTTLPEALQNEQVLEDLLVAFMEEDHPLKIHSGLQESIIAVLETYPPYKSKIPDAKLTNVKDFIFAIKDQIHAENKSAREAYEKDPRYKPLEDFDLRNAQFLSSETGGAFSHPTIQASKRVKTQEEIEGKPEKKKGIIASIIEYFGEEDQGQRKHQYPWFIKFIMRKALAVREVVGQEFFRLIINYQPKTRIVKTKDGEIRIDSKGTLMGKSLGEIDTAVLYQKINSGQYTGLGRVMVMSLLLQETDLKRGNLRVNEFGQIFKIDGDRLLDRFRTGIDYKITAADIAKLPFITAFPVGNWLDIFQHKSVAVKPEKANAENADEAAPKAEKRKNKTVYNKAYDDPNAEKILNIELLEDATNFRREINETLLKTLLMPTVAVNTFVERYTHDKGETKLLATEITRRLAQIREAALQEKSFLKYAASDEAKQYAKQCMKEYLEFKPYKKNTIFNGGHVTVMKRKFSEIQTAAKEARAPKKENHQAPPEVRPATPEKKRPSIEGELILPAITTQKPTQQQESSVMLVKGKHAATQESSVMLVRRKSSNSEINLPSINEDRPSSRASAQALPSINEKPQENSNRLFTTRKKPADNLELPPVTNARKVRNRS